MASRDDELLARYLDVELSDEALPEALRERARALDQLFAPAREEAVRFPAGFRQAVMRRVRQARPDTRLRDVWDWIVTPRTFRLSPGTVALAAAAIVTLVIVTRVGGPADSGAPAVAVTVEQSPVRFVFVAPQARSVAVSGGFVGWDPEGIPMRHEGDGRWVVEVRLPPGVHHYVFVVDGTDWRPDPHATSQVDDGFGQQNSVLLVPERRSS